MPPVMRRIFSLCFIKAKHYNNLVLNVLTLLNIMLKLLRKCGGQQMDWHK